MIRQHIVDILNKYSFIDSAKIENAKLIIKYNNGKIKRLPIRANKDQLKQTIANIKKEMGEKINARNEIVWFV